MFDFSLTEKQKEIILNKGLKLKKVEKQISFILDKLNNNSGKLSNSLHLVSPVVRGKGIVSIENNTDSAQQEREDLFNKYLNDNQICKFVPASGASSRMFAFLNKYYFYLQSKFEPNADGLNPYPGESEQRQTEHFFNNLENFAFFSELSDCLSSLNIGHTLLDKNNEENRYKILTYFLYNGQKGYLINKLKGEVPFHFVKNCKTEHCDKCIHINCDLRTEYRTEISNLNAFQSHILEAFFVTATPNQAYSLEQLLLQLNSLMTLEFSISENLHQNITETEYNKYQKSGLKKIIGVFNYNLLSNFYNLTASSTDIINLFNEEVISILENKVRWSTQDSKTDSLAIIKNGGYELLTDENGDLITRAAGHGALLKNIQEIDEDYIFIKNIDNITKPALTKKYNYHIKNIIGFTAEIKEKLDNLHKQIDIIFAKYCLNRNANTAVDKQSLLIINETEKFIQKYFIEEYVVHQVEIVDDEFCAKLQEIISILARPLRVCAMVENTGEPGGGPFYVDLNSKKGNTILTRYHSKQIIELSQVDTNNIEQLEIVNQSKFFNPVFMVLNIKRYDGVKHNLTDFVDGKTAMVVEKHYANKDIYSYEYPGLWNGSMAFWNTIFIEMPMEIFHPVKIVNDLLKLGHAVYG